MLRCERLLKRLGCSSAAVLVEVTFDGKLLAGAQGGNLNGHAVGRVIVDDYLLRLLPDEELEFVLAHEVAHIFRNHFASTLTTAVVREVVEDAAREDATIKAVLLAWDVWKVIRAVGGELSPAASTTRHNEFEADAYAVWLIGDKEIAKRSLLRLVGNDLDAPSHTWEVFGQTMPRPVLSMRERIAGLDSLPFG